jgi:hypothetical protein
VDGGGGVQGRKKRTGRERERERRWSRRACDVRKSVLGERAAKACLLGPWFDDRTGLAGYGKPMQEPQKERER